MINRTPKFLIAVLAAAVCAIHAPAQTNSAPPSAPPDLGGPADNSPGLDSDRILAKGKGVVVKRSDIDSMLATVHARIAQSGREIPPVLEDRYERMALDQIIASQVLLATASDDDRAQGRGMADKQIQQMLKEPDSAEAFNQQLKSLGLTQVQVSKQLADKFTSQMHELRALGIVVTDADVKKYYDDHPSEFEQPEMVRVQHILIRTSDPVTGEMSDDQKADKRKQIEGLLKRARAGEDFASLAKQYSEDPGSRSKGGEYTFWRGQMVPEFEGAAFSLKTNQISDVVTTQFGYHIIKLLERIPAKKLPFETEKMAPYIKQVLESRAIATDKQLPDLMAKLNKDAGVEILDEHLKEVIIPPPTDESADEPARTDETNKTTDGGK